MAIEKKIDGYDVKNVRGQTSVKKPYKVVGRTASFKGNAEWSDIIAWERKQQRIDEERRRNNMTRDEKRKLLKQEIQAELEG